MITNSTSFPRGAWERTSQTLHVPNQEKFHVPVKNFRYAVLSIIFLCPVAHAQTAQDKQATICFLQDLQTPSGGFLVGPENPKIKRPTAASLRATNAGLRALKYFGAQPRDLKAAGRFVESCFDRSTGGFADRPGAEPDAMTTAVGIMAVVEANLPTEPYAGTVVKYLGEHSRTFEEVRLAAAGIEAISKPSPKADDWLKQIAAMQNPDGLFGKGRGAARETGSAAAAILRLGGKLEHPDRVVTIMKEGQRSDGAYGKEDVETSDLESSYRIIRSLHMLKEKPANPDRVRAFIAKCRNTDGGYGVTPGQPSSAGGTYFAAIILHWLDEK